MAVQATYTAESTLRYMKTIASLFKDIRLRYKTKTGYDYSRIPLFIASPERRISKSEESESTRHTAPSIGIQVTSIDFDENRAMDSTNRIMSADRAQYVFQPSPYNYTVDIGVYAKRESELHQIMETIVTYYHKARYPKIIDFEFSDGSTINRRVPIEIQSTPINIEALDQGVEDEQKFTATLSFMVKGWMYGSNPTLTGDGTNVLIENVNLFFSNELGSVIDEMNIYENTGGDVVIDIEC